MFQHATVHQALPGPPTQLHLSVFEQCLGPLTYINFALVYYLHLILSFINYCLLMTIEILELRTFPKHHDFRVNTSQGSEALHLDLAALAILGSWWRQK